MRLGSRSCFLALLLVALLSATSLAQIPDHPLAAYADRLSVQPGQVIHFMVSSEAPQYEAQLVRLIHENTNPDGPSYREQELDASFNGPHDGHLQPLENGSSAVVADHRALDLTGSFSLVAWIYPTTPDAGTQAIISKWSAAKRSGYALRLEDDGSVGLLFGDGSHETNLRTGASIPVYLRSEKAYPAGTPLHSSLWLLAAATFDAVTGIATVYQWPHTVWPNHPAAGTVSLETSAHAVATNDLALTIAATPGLGDAATSEHFNGKIEAPRIYDRALTADEITGLSKEQVPPEPVAAWDFSRRIQTREVEDTSGNDLHGHTRHLPKRAVTGHNWDGSEMDFKRAPEHYGVIHFHDDDLDDAGWTRSFEYTVPNDLKSGIYAARLRAAEDEDYIPFYVRSVAGTATSEVAFLVPTFSYLAYANGFGVGGKQLLSLYDKHSDGSGVTYSSRLLPILNMRPERSGKWGDMTFPHQFTADLHLVDWLEKMGHSYDVITDEDLHWEGTDLLSPYHVVLTGSHPEYWSEQMLDALAAYLNLGGRLMYLGGNGFYWVTNMDPVHRHTVEIRRWGGTQTWGAQPGEHYLSTTGEMGGLWRARGRAPQRLVGVGFTAQGPGRGMPFARQPDSSAPRARFIFEGVGDNELIGDFPSLVMEYGASSFEIDRMDFQLGTPPHALLLATASGHPEQYEHVIEQVYQSNQGPVDALVKSDMVYFEYPAGGAVFTVGSIGWDGCLSYNDYDNNVSRITDNVLRRFRSAEPLSPIPQQ
jgi:N,N-dimethylformamidase